MTIPANVVPAVSSLLLVSCDAPLGNVRVAVPPVAGKWTPCQFVAVVQLASPPAPVHVQLVQADGLIVTVVVFVSAEPSSFALIVAVPTVVEVNVAVYVPLPLSVVAQLVVHAPAKVPTVVETVTVPPLEVRFDPAEFFSWTVIVELVTPSLTIGFVPGVMVDWDNDAVAVFVTDWAPIVAARLPALSWRLFVPGCVYATVGVAPP